MVKKIKAIIVFCLGTFLSFGQGDGLYIGTDLGISILKSKFNYSFENDQPELVDGFLYNSEKGASARIFLGYALKKHRFELSVQNFQIKNGFAIEYPEIAFASNVVKGGIYTSFTYLFEPLRFKKFFLELGPHIGFAIAGKSDFGATEK